MVESPFLMLTDISLPYDVHKNIHKMRFFNEPTADLFKGSRVLPLVSNEVWKAPKNTDRVYDPFQGGPHNVPVAHGFTNNPNSIQDLMRRFPNHREHYDFGSDPLYYPQTTPQPYHHRPTSKTKKKPLSKDPEKYLAVIPYKDVHNLFNTLNKYTKPHQMKTTKRTTMKPKTTKMTTMKATTKKAKKKKKKSKKKKKIKHKTKVEVR